MSQIKLQNGQYLIREELPKKKEVALSKVEEAINRIVVIDGSGSMYGDIDGVVKDVIEQCRQMSSKDKVSVGYFSSEGQWGWICKGAAPSDVEKLIKDFRFPMCMTCYSEILADIKNLVKDLTPLSNKFALVFLSDGFPNQRTNSIIPILKELAPLISTSMLVGYQSYYGRELMASMAQALGGVLVHSDNLREFSKHFTSFREGTTHVSPRVEIAVPKGANEFVVSLGSNGEIISHTIETGKILVSPETEALVYVSNTKPAKSVILTEETGLLESVYAFARASLQAGNYNLALETLAVIGDVKYIDMVNNAFTINENGKVENELLEAISDPNMRFVKGQKANYLPKSDAFCGLDLMDALTKDETAVFLPKHPAFSYRSISRKTRNKNPELKINVPNDVEVRLQDLVWSSDALNLSARTKAYGTVTLDKNAASHKLDQQFKAFEWKNYALISDGKWNVQELPVRNLSPETLKLVRENGLIKSENGTTILELTRIPVINRKIAESYTDLNKVCKLLKDEIRLEAEQKTFKNFYSLLPQELQDQIDNLVKPSAFTPEQVAYLEQFGIEKDGSFSPEKETLPATDFILINEMCFAVAGFSSVPKIADVQKKIAEKKKLTPSQQLVADSISKYESETANDSEKSKALWLKEKIDEVRSELFKIRSELNRVKFAVILGKSNFDQLKKLNEGTNDYVYDGLTYKIKINKNVRVDI